MSDFTANDARKLKKQSWEFYYKDIIEKIKGEAQRGYNHLSYTLNHVGCSHKQILTKALKKNGFDVQNTDGAIMYIYWQKE